MQFYQIYQRHKADGVLGIITPIKVKQLRSADIRIQSTITTDISLAIMPLVGFLCGKVSLIQDMLTIGTTRRGNGTLSGIQEHFGTAIGAAGMKKEFID